MKGYIKEISGIIPHTYKKVNIQLDGKNLIITGGNASGKTSFLRSAYDKTVLFIIDKKYEILPDLKARLLNYENTLSSFEKGSKQYRDYSSYIDNTQKEIEKIEGGINLHIPKNTTFSAKYDDRTAVIKYFEDSRLADIREATMPQGIQTEIEQNQKATHNHNVGSNLEQHLLNLRIRRSTAITEDKDQPLADSISEWFKEFEKNLKFLFEYELVELKFDSDRNKFSISQDSKPPYTFQTLSAGYRAIFDIYSDLLMRTKYFSVTPAELEGVVFIDEIDSHLHVSLQRLILPFFINSFPKIQFIVTTHSPFVLMSSRNIIVYDLGKNEQVTVSQVKTQNEILNDFLSVPVAMPVWAANSLEEILNNYLSREPDNISLAALKQELVTAGLETYFPDSVSKILETK